MTYMTDRDRAPHAHEVLESPLFAQVRPGSGIEIAWGLVQSPHTLTVLGYEPVRPDQVEKLPGGSYFPQKKDIGMYLDLDKKADIVRVGEHILMFITAERKAARIKREQEKARSLRPKKADESDRDTESEDTSTINKELAPQQ